MTNINPQGTPQSVVERLRERARHLACSPNNWHQVAELNEAASRIENLEAAPQPFANFGEFLEVETSGFDDADTLSLITEDGHLLARFGVGEFRKARSTLSPEGEG